MQIQLQKRRTLAKVKPFTAAELSAKTRAETQLALARLYRERGGVDSALSCCLTGLRVTIGVSRPLSVRDQLHDLCCQIDPSFRHSG